MKIDLRFLWKAGRIKSPVCLTNTPKNKIKPDQAELLKHMAMNNKLEKIDSVKKRGVQNEFIVSRAAHVIFKKGEFKILKPSQMHTVSKKAWRSLAPMSQ